MLAFAAITAIEFKAAGLEFLPVIKDYDVAAKAKLGSSSLFGLVENLISWPFVSSVNFFLCFLRCHSVSGSCASAARALSSEPMPHVSLR